MTDKAAHQAHYERESAQKTLSAAELHAKLAEVIAAGHGDRPVFIMVTGTGDGMTHADPIGDCFSGLPFDGDVVWITGA
jgi:hypothetical protein